MRTVLILRGSISKIASMIPGMPQGMMEGNEEETSGKLKRMIFITDAMRGDELDSDGMIFVQFDKNGTPIGLNKRARRVAQGSGTSVREVEELLAQARMMAGMAKQAGGQNGWSVLRDRSMTGAYVQDVRYEQDAGRYGR